MNTVLVLGKKGGLGHMVERVLSRSEALVTHGTCRGHESDPFDFNVENGLSGLQRIVEDNGPFDYLINCIGVLRPDIDERDAESVRRAERINSRFPHALADLADQIGARVIQISTDGVFSDGAGVCLEDTPTSCADSYGKTKSSGEVIAPGVLNLRCSIIGPHPRKKEGLVEWFRSQEPGAEIPGYTDHLWNGVTTLQLARLCRLVILEQRFDSIRSEGPVHHFCPNQVVTKEELLQIFKLEFEQQVTIKPVPAPWGPVNRVLDTRYVEIRKLYGHDLPTQEAIRELAAEICGTLQHFE